METAASIDAVIGASLTTRLPVSLLSILFGLLLLFAAVSTVRKRRDALVDPHPKGWARTLRMYGSYPSAAEGPTDYAARNVFGGWMVRPPSGHRPAHLQHGRHARGLRGYHGRVDDAASLADAVVRLMQDTDAPRWGKRGRALLGPP